MTYTIKNLNTVATAYGTDATISDNVIFDATKELVVLYKIVRNTAMKQNLFNTQEWINFEDFVNDISTADPTIPCEF